MAKEIRGVATSGILYAVILNRSGQWWNGTTLEAYSALNYSTYDVAMAEEGNSGIYTADFPTGIAASGTYEYFVKRQLGGAPAEADPVVNTGKVDWTGTVALGSSPGAMTGSDFRDYVLRRGFKRTDKDAELYEAVTDAIQMMRRRFSFNEAEAEAETTDQISALGDFKLDLEDDHGLLMGVVLEDGDTGTPLDLVHKSRFDELYPSINVEADRGYPRHYTVYAGQIYLGPKPDSVSYDYRLTYSRKAGTITSSSTSVPFTAEYRDVIGDLTLARLYESLEEFDKAGYFYGKFEEELVRAMRREKKNSGEGTFMMRPTC